jgi:POT family proton-dependent oligopeptide transporter
VSNLVAATEPMNSAVSTTESTHPKGFYFFFWGEFAERCSYYGMRAILPLYLTTVLKFEDGAATKTYSLFKAACYFLPLLGGFLADRFLGKYRTIVTFAIPYVIGQFLLLIPSQMALFAALVLLAGGSGVIKPNISTLMGLTYDQQRPGQIALRTSAFQWFYFSINVGSLLSLFSLPIIREKVIAATGDAALAYRVAFSIPAAFMFCALIAFAAGKKHYAKETIDRSEPTAEDKALRWKTLVNLFGIFGLVVFFWLAYEQNDNLWTFFARDYMDRRIFGYEFAPDGFQYLNAFLVLVFIPLFDVVFRKVDPELKFFRPTVKMLMGLIATALSAGVMALAAQQAAGGDKVTAWWIVLAYVVLTFGEVLLYGTGLELAFSAAPPSMKSFVTACFLITNAIANTINSQLSPYYGKVLSPRDYFGVTMIVTLCASVAFYFVGKRFSRANPPPATATT